MRLAFFFFLHLSAYSLVKVLAHPAFFIILMKGEVSARPQPEQLKSDRKHSFIQMTPMTAHEGIFRSHKESSVQPQLSTQPSLERR